MEVSRLYFSKETKEKMSKGLNKRQLGKLRYEKLRELAESGKLSSAKNRIDVMRAVGFTDEQYKTGYSWVTNMINRKALTERVVGFGKNNKAEYEYTLGSRVPDYDNIKAQKVRWGKPIEEPTPEKPKAMVWVDECAKALNTYKLEFSNDNIKIRIELNDYEKVANLIKDILKG